MGRKIKSHFIDELQVFGYDVSPTKNYYHNQLAAPLVATYNSRTIRCPVRLAIRNEQLKLSNKKIEFHSFICFQSVRSTFFKDDDEKSGVKEDGEYRCSLPKEQCRMAIKPHYVVAPENNEQATVYENDCDILVMDNQGEVISPRKAYPVCVHIGGVSPAVKNEPLRDYLLSKHYLIEESEDGSGTPQEASIDLISYIEAPTEEGSKIIVTYHCLIVDVNCFMALRDTLKEEELEVNDLPQILADLNINPEPMRAFIDEPNESNIEELILKMSDLVHSSELTEKERDYFTHSFLPALKNELLLKQALNHRGLKKALNTESEFNIWWERETSRNDLSQSVKDLLSVLHEQSIKCLEEAYPKSSQSAYSAPKKKEGLAIQTSYNQKPQIQPALRKPPIQHASTARWLLLALSVGVGLLTGLLSYGVFGLGIGIVTAVSSTVVAVGAQYFLNHQVKSSTSTVTSISQDKTNERASSQNDIEESQSQSQKIKQESTSVGSLKRNNSLTFFPLEKEEKKETGKSEATVSPHKRH